MVGLIDVASVLNEDLDVSVVSIPGWTALFSLAVQKDWAEVHRPLNTNNEQCQDQQQQQHQHIGS